ncbi:MAG: GH3 family domain-containing protein [Bacteroidota bacterium]
MNFFGTIIKSAIEFRDKVKEPVQPEKAQEEVLFKLLNKAKHTHFGRHYNFEKLLIDSNVKQAFAKKIPFFSYEKINQEWWYLLHQGKEDITWPGKPSYYAISSGTTGKSSKKIPVTDEMLSALRKTAIEQIEALANFDLPPEFFQKEIMMLGSSTNLKEADGHLEGEISGISASNIPFWFSGYYKPGEEIAKIDDWDDRIQKIAENAKKWDIGALSGIPTWIELMLSKVIEYHQVENIHQIWPNLQVYTSGGVAFEPYEKSFNKLLGRPIEVIDTYLASEGFIAFQERPETNAMKLDVDNGIYFEFVPFEPEYINPDGSLIENAPSLNITEVENEKEYVLIISTVAGLWRYEIGDTIKFTDKDRCEIRITGRTKFFLNVAGSQLSVNKMNDAIQLLEEKFDIEIPEFTVAAVRRGNDFIHSWYLGSTGNAAEEKLAEHLDDYLKDANKNYRVARSKALKSVELKLISPEVFYEWSEANKKKGGQVKMEKVMTEEKFSQWESFVKSNT